MPDRHRLKTQPIQGGEQATATHSLIVEPSRFEAIQSKPTNGNGQPQLATNLITSLIITITVTAPYTIPTASNIVCWTRSAPASRSYGHARLRLANHIHLRSRQLAPRLLPSSRSFILFRISRHFRHPLQQRQQRPKKGIITLCPIRDPHVFQLFWHRGQKGFLRSTERCGSHPSAFRWRSSTIWLALRSHSPSTTHTCQSTQLRKQHRLTHQGQRSRQPLQPHLHVSPRQPRL